MRLGDIAQPQERSRNAIARDLRLGYVTEAHVAKTYPQAAE